MTLEWYDSIINAWYYWTGLVVGQWAVVFFFSMLFLIVFYTFIRPHIFKQRRHRDGYGRYRVSLILIPSIFIAVYYGYLNESVFKFKEFVYIPFTRFLLGDFSCMTFGAFMFVSGIMLIGLAFFKWTMDDWDISKEHVKEV